MPRNAVTGARYRGINTIVLGMSPLAFGSSDPRWATYKQSADRGWQFKKGERGTTAYFFKRLEVRDDRGDSGDSGEEGTKRIPLLLAFTLFHVSQIEGAPEFVPPTVAEAPWRAPDGVETIVGNSGAVVRIGGERAFYSPVTDHVQIPPRHAFHSASGWSSTILHEIAHNAASRIMPHDSADFLRDIAQAVRRVGIIRAPRERRAGCRRGGIAPGWRSVRSPATRPSPSAADRRGCRSAWSRRTRAPARGRSQTGRPRAGAVPSRCCASACED